MNWNQAAQDLRETELITTIDTLKAQLAAAEATIERLTSEQAERLLDTVRAVGVTVARTADGERWSVTNDRAEQAERDMHEVQFAIYGALIWGFDPNSVNKANILRAVTEMARAASRSRADKRAAMERLTDDEVIEVCVGVVMAQSLPLPMRKNGREIIATVRAKRLAALEDKP